MSKINSQPYKSQPFIVTEKKETSVWMKVLYFILILILILIVLSVSSKYSGNKDAQKYKYDTVESLNGLKFSHQENTEDGTMVATAILRSDPDKGVSLNYIITKPGAETDKRTLTAFFPIEDIVTKMDLTNHIIEGISSALPSASPSSEFSPVKFQVIDNGINSVTLEFAETKEGGISDSITYTYV